MAAEDPSQAPNGPLAWLQQGLIQGRRLSNQLSRSMHLATSRLQNRSSDIQDQSDNQNMALSKRSMHVEDDVSSSSMPGADLVLAHPALAVAPPPRPPRGASSTIVSFGSGPADKAELGRATWMLLHTLAAQFPANPSRQQQRDVRSLIDTLTRIYPCGDCARHFSEIVRHDPPVVNSGPELQQWLCRVHNTVNRSLDKPNFNCAIVGSRWTPLNCGELSSCDMTVGASDIRR